MKKLFHSARWFLLALLLPLIPATQAHAGVFVSVNFGPPVLPVYVQPMCPDPDLIWTPGYWAYGPDGYYWVPGAWVPAPYVGALWTPPYWGYDGGLYMFHPGYWGSHVGYYGGINYGFGYFGIGFVGGMWNGGRFRYNTAYMNVDRGRIHDFYEDRDIGRRYTVANDRRVAFSGGPGGINHRPSQEERSYMNERHVSPTSFQSQHEMGARNDRTSYARANNGRPQNLVAQRPLGAENHTAPGGSRSTFNGQRTANNGVPANRSAAGNQQGRPAFNQTQQRQTVNQQQRQMSNQPAQQRQTFNQPAQQRQTFNQPASRPSAPQQQRSAPVQRSAPEQRSAPQQQRSAPQHEQARPQEHPHEPHGR